MRQCNSYNTTTQYCTEQYASPCSLQRPTYSAAWWCRTALLLLLACHGVELYLDIQFPSAIAPPGLGLVKPICGIAACYVCFFVDSHPCFRWMVRAATTVITFSGNLLL